MAKAKLKKYINIIEDGDGKIDGRIKHMTEKSYGMIGSVIKFGKKYEHAGYVPYDEKLHGQKGGSDEMSEEAKNIASGTKASSLNEKIKEVKKLKSAATRAENKAEKEPTEENIADANVKRDAANQAEKELEELSE